MTKRRAVGMREKLNEVGTEQRTHALLDDIIAGSPASSRVRPRVGNLNLLHRVLRRLADERGQVLVFFLLAVVPLLLMVGLVIDIGHARWRSRVVQAAADAAVLAGAQGNSVGVAQAYATTNDPNISCVFTVPQPEALHAACTERVKMSFIALAGSRFKYATVKASAQAQHKEARECWSRDGSTQDPRYPATRPNRCQPLQAAWHIVVVLRSVLTQ